MDWLLLSIMSAIVSWIVALLVCRHAARLRLVLEPNHRSSHVQPTPSGGGLGIAVAGSLVGIGLDFVSGWASGWFVAALAIVLAAVSLWDDVQHLPARVRFGVQVAVCAGLLLLLGDLPGTFLLRGDAAEGVNFQLFGWIVSALLLLAGVWWINLFNFMDGLDGIAGSQAVFMLAAGAGLAVWNQPFLVTDPAWVWAVCIAAATLGFLPLNWPPAKIFMGDVGSTYLAFMIFVVALISLHAGWFGSPLAGFATWLTLGAVFVVDATVTLLVRMASGERWYEAHRTHVYQKLARRWGGHRPVTFLAVTLNVFWVGPLALACVLWPQWGLIWVALVYVPLVIGAVMLGAGRADEMQPMVQTDQSA
jgi:Fuc2NAc and GlcNAc transferase